MGSLHLGNLGFLSTSQLQNSGDACMVAHSCCSRAPTDSCIYCLLRPKLRKHPVSLPQFITYRLMQIKVKRFNFFMGKWQDSRRTYGMGKKKLSLYFENSAWNMKKGTQNVACYGDMKCIAIATTYLVSLAMASRHCIGKIKAKTRFQWL